MEHRIVYENGDSYCAFPDVARLRSGELIIVFREADRRRFATHLDRTARISLIRSADEGKTWRDKITVYDEPEASLQDPSVRQLSDGTLILSFFKWIIGKDTDSPPWYTGVRMLDEDHAAWMAGVFVMTSRDEGKTWTAPVRVNGEDLPAATSDAVAELPSGELLCPLEVFKLGSVEVAGVVRSRDGGRSWGEFRMIGHDPFGQIGFYEPALLVRGEKILCMLRTHLLGLSSSESSSFLYQSESVDGGRTWSVPVRTPMWGHPAHLHALRDGRILCAYGYRRVPYGIRAAVSADEGRSWDIMHEIVLRADGKSDDLGYPTSVQLRDGRVLTTYYMHPLEEDWRLGHALIGATVYDVQG